MPACDAIGQGTREHRREWRRAQKYCDPDPDFMSQIEETEQIWYAWPKASLKNSQKEAQGHHPRPINCGRLTGGADTPAEDGEGEPHVGRNDLPHQGLPFEQDVCYI